MLKMKDTSINKRPRRRSALASIFLTLTLTLGLLTGVAPVSMAVAAPKAPSATPVGSTAVQVKWSAVSGATHYVVRYSTTTTFNASSPTQLVEGKTSAAVTDLKTGTKYNFQVAVADENGSTEGNEWSAVVSATPNHTKPAPTGLQVDNVGGKSIELYWTGVSGASGYLVRAESSGNAAVEASTRSNRIVVTGLKKSTKYSLKVYVEDPATDELPALQQGPFSAAISVTTSNNDLAAPGNFRVAEQGSTSIKLAWDTPEGMQSGYQYEAQYALNSGMTDGMKWFGTKAKADANSLTVTGLTNNTNYYMRVRVVDSSGKQRSDTSDFVLGKTRVPLGTIKGKVSGAPANDIVVAAHTTGNQLVAQADVKSDGSYELSVRPGSYRVYATYLGKEGYTSLWAASGSNGGRITSEASTVSVSENKSSTAPTITLGKGATISGTIYDPSGKPVPSVDVTALSAHTSAREVVTLVRGNSNGTYELRGLPDGQYWLRMIYSGDGFNTRSIWIDVKDGKMAAFRVSSDKNATSVSGVTALNAKLDNAPFRKSYKAYINGTKKVGQTVSVHATEWLAGSYPTTRATMTFQWKRNGAAIPGATGRTYKLVAADRGKNLTVTATAKLYGYQTGSTTSKAHKIK